MLCHSASPHFLSLPNSIRLPCCGTSILSVPTALWHLQKTFCQQLDSHSTWASFCLMVNQEKSINAVRLVEEGQNGSRGWTEQGGDGTEGVKSGSRRGWTGNLPGPNQLSQVNTELEIIPITNVVTLHSVHAIRLDSLSSYLFGTHFTRNFSCTSVTNFMRVPTFQQS